MILKIHKTLTFSYTKITHYFASAPFLSKSASYPDILFSLISPAQSVYTKYTLNRHTILNHILLWILKQWYTHFWIRIWIWSGVMKLRPSNLWISVWITDLKRIKSLRKMTWCPGPNDYLGLSFSRTCGLQISHYVKSGNYVGKTFSL